MVRPPIACTLSADAVEGRIDEWRRFLARSVQSFERPTPLLLRVELDASPGVVEAAADLARREKACCAFFAFSIDVEAEAPWLSVRVPPEARGTLDDFAALLPGPA